jgi:hypothetical protein
MSLRCSICGESFWPSWTWRDEWCQECHTMNFAASQELRLHDPSVDALREATHRGYEADCRAAWPPTPRQVQARRRIAPPPRHEAGEEAP